MKPYLVFSRSQYSRLWDMDEYRTAEEAATRALGREDGEKILVARRLTLKVSLEEAPEVGPETEPIPIPEMVEAETPAVEFGKLESTEKVEEPF